MGVNYRCVATSVAGFVQQLAVAYITHGYWFYVAGEIPEGKNLEAVDAKLIDRYGIAISKWARCRRKKQGLANMQYLRHERFFVLIATGGTHAFFHRECMSIRDIRNVPLKFAGYSIGCRKGNDGRWHPSVRIEQTVYAAMKAQLVETGLYCGKRAVERMVVESPYLPFAPIQRQFQDAWRAMNRERRTVGLTPLQANVSPQRKLRGSPF